MPRHFTRPTSLRNVLLPSRIKEILAMPYAQRMRHMRMLRYLLPRK